MICGEEVRFVKRSLALVASVPFVALALSLAVPARAQQPAKIDATILAKVGAVLRGYHVAQAPLQTRGNSVSDLYWARVWDVPVVISSDGLGSSVVLGTDIVDQKRHAWVITNNHVVEHPFTIKGHSVVFLVFYDPVLKNEFFDPDRISNCFASPPDETEWCRAFRSSSRLAAVVDTDPSRDLALLSVFEPPARATGVPGGNIQTLQPGDSVAIIGNPLNLLWSLTTGSISAIRTNFLLGTGLGTMIQTQAPVNPGNSGGPLFGPDGRLVGVVYASRAGDTVEVQGRAVKVPTEGLNFALGVNEVLAFLKSHP
jgi:S1-C subfamily serine protease